MSIQKATGDMYEWVDYVHSYMRGECPYKCPYCYVRSVARRFDNGALQGKLRFADKEFKANYKIPKYHGKTIFIEHTHDLFSDQQGFDGMASIDFLLDKCCDAPETQFVFQTRNVSRAASPQWRFRFPRNAIIGTTIETNRYIPGPPHPFDRALYLPWLKIQERQTFVTIEPILKFDHDEMIGLLKMANPDFINIGADSKGTGLEEPTALEVLNLITAIKGLGIQIRTKRNLERIMKSTERR
jgi:DNA repair photolyase